MKTTAYLFQATLVAVWWIGLYANEAVFAAFQYPGIGPLAFKSFLLPDLFLIVLLSVLRAYRQLPQLEFVILGGFAFGTLYCINASWLTGGGYLSSTLMVLGLCYNLFLIFGRSSFRTSAQTDVKWNALKTLVQTLSVWTITLALFPYLLMLAFGNDLEVDQPGLLIGSVLFVLMSSLGLTSAYFMVKQGEGTPLPLDQTNKLVVSGPYRFVRNPMAVAGIGQGIAVAVIFGSFPVLVYALLGGVAWQLVVRPLEEADMLERFGEEYAAYRLRVRCWWPNIRLN